MIKKYKDYDTVNERQERYFNQLKIDLEQAIKTAERMGEDAKMNPGNYEGWEGMEIDQLLNDIYAAYMTGNRKDKSHNDEIFK